MRVKKDKLKLNFTGAVEGLLWGSYPWKLHIQQWEPGLLLPARCCFCCPPVPGMRPWTEIWVLGEAELGNLSQLRTQVVVGLTAFSACLLGSFSAKSHLLMVGDRGTAAPLLDSQLGSSMSPPVSLVLTHVVLTVVLG